MSAASRVPADAFDKAVAAVLDGDTCSGCGACALINPNYAMRLSDEGYNRPVREGELKLTSREIAERTSDLRASCPGLRVVAPHPAGVLRDEFLGPVVSSWEAWSTDDELRFRGSSGGTLTALSAWLLKEGRTARVIGARSTPGAPSTTQSVVIGLPLGIRDIAGSRYGPVSNAAVPEAVDPQTTFVGKPCEVSSIRQLAQNRGSEAPILMSFFCAGVPSQQSTDQLIETLGIPHGTPLRSMRYRGHGWPGNFHAEDENGNTVSATYDESWGKSLGPTVQWRCKICPDGMGESADIVAGDFWRTDERGYPVFDDGAGISALIARTPRGHAIITEALAAGAISAVPLEVGRIAAIQPLQIARRQTLFGRMLGRFLAGRRVPTFRGFGLLRQAVKNPEKNLRFAYGSFRRSRKRAPARERSAR